MREQAPLVAVNEMVYAFGVVKFLDGFSKEENPVDDVGSPKSHQYEVAPVEVFVKNTN